MSKLKPRKDLTGRVFGHLTVIDQADDYVSPKGAHVAKWLCQCDCGKTKIVSGSLLRSGNVNSCGHLRKKPFREIESHTGNQDIYNKDGKFVVKRRITQGDVLISIYAGVYADFKDAQKARDVVDKLVHTNRAYKEQLPDKLLPGIRVVHEINNTKYQADANVDGKTKRVGVYSTYVEAVAAQDAFLRGAGITKRIMKPEQDNVNLRQKYDEKRVDGVAMQLFKGELPRTDSSTGYRGVRSYPIKGGSEERFRATITISGKSHSKGGFLTAKDAYYIGRLELEAKYLPHTK